MNPHLPIAFLLCLLGNAAAQTVTLPAGTNLPVRLGHELAAGKLKPGTPIQVHTTQPVPIASHRDLPRNTELDGVIVASTRAGNGQPALLDSVRFDTIRLHGEPIPVRTRALAAAGFALVSQAGDLCSGPGDRANPNPADWTTCQVGGDQVARSGWQGPVINDVTQTVGFANFGGVYALPTHPGALPQALGVFSTTAQGLYGFPAGSALRSEAGIITFTAPGKFVLHGNDNLLLQTEPLTSATVPTSPAR